MNTISFTLDASDERADQILEIIRGGAAPKPAAKKAATKKPAAKKAAAKKTPSTSAAKAAPAEGDVTIDDVRAALNAKKDDYRPEIKAKLEELGAKNVSSLDEEHYLEAKEYFDSLGEEDDLD